MESNNDFIRKDLFIEAIKCLKKQMKTDSSFAGHMSSAFKESLGIFLPPNDGLIKGFISLLEKLTHDDSKWIDYYIYETNFGKSKGFVVWDEENNPIRFKTPSDLYNLLYNNYKNDIK